MKYILIIAIFLGGCSSTLLTLDLSDNTMIVEGKQPKGSINFRGMRR